MCGEGGEWQTLSCFIHQSSDWLLRSKSSALISPAVLPGAVESVASAEVVEGVAEVVVAAEESGTAAGGGGEADIT